MEPREEPGGDWYSDFAEMVCVGDDIPGLVVFDEAGPMSADVFNLPREQVNAPGSVLTDAAKLVAEIKANLFDAPEYEI